MADRAALGALLARDGVCVEPFAQSDVEGLRGLCAEDPEIWEIFPVCMTGDHFDPVIEQRLGSSEWINFAVRSNGELAGITGYIRPDPVNAAVEIGGTYIAPRYRGGTLNGMVKRLMIDHAFACGFRRIEFRVDERNGRSQAAVMKLGAMREGLLRQDRVTWTGHVRNTCVFGLLREDWQA